MLASIIMDPDFLGEPRSSLLHRLIEIAWPEDENQRQRIEEQYKCAADDVDDDEGDCDDPEMQELLLEMAMHDHENAQDLQAFKKDLDKEAVQKLEKRRRAAREAKVLEKAERAAKAKARRVAAKKLGPKGRRLAASKRRSNAPSSKGRSKGAPPAVVVPDAKVARGDSTLEALPSSGIVDGLGGTLEPPPTPDIVDGLRAPRAGGVGEWRVIKVPNGYVRWSAKLARLDAHCRVHTDQKKECKMDRTLARGGVGLSWLWMKHAASVDYFGHQLQKEQFSSVEARDDRAAERKRIVDAASSDEELAALLTAEREARGGEVHEPDIIQCRSILPS